MENSTVAIRGSVVAVCRNPEPGLPKPIVEHIYLLADLGVEGDYHAGKFVRHRYLANKYPTRRNMRQILIVDGATYTELTRTGIAIGPGAMGENITIEGIGVMELPEGTRLAVGGAVIEVTEIRKPCKQLNGTEPNLLQAVTTKEAGKTSYRAGIMTRVLQAGWVRAGDRVTLLTPDAVQQPVLF